MFIYIQKILFFTALFTFKNCIDITCAFISGSKTLALYIPVFISDLINFMSMAFDMLFGFDIDYSISTMTKFLGSLFMMGIGMGEINNMLIWLGFLSGGALGLWVVILTLPFTLPFLLLSRN